MCNLVIFVCDDIEAVVVNLIINPLLLIYKKNIKKLYSTLLDISNKSETKLNIYLVHIHIYRSDATCRLTSNYNVVRNTAVKWAVQDRPTKPYPK